MTTAQGRELPRLIGVIHLGALVGSPGFGSGSSIEAVVDAAAADAEQLSKAGFDGIIVENFGDVPFAREQVDSVTVASMTRCALAVQSAAPGCVIGVNILRNDAHSALAVAAAVGASMVRVNVHVGARLCDQGIVQGDAYNTLRRRQQLGIDKGDRRVALLCDIAVKHSSPLAELPIELEAEEAVGRGLADAVLITGSGTGKPADDALIGRVLSVTDAPILVASGATHEGVGQLMRRRAAGRLHGVIVGSCLRMGGRAGDAVCADLSARFAEAFRSV